MAVCKCSHGVFKRTDGNIQVQRWHYSGKISKLVQPRQCSSAVMTVFKSAAFKCSHSSIQVQPWRYSSAISNKCSLGSIPEQPSAAVFKCSHGSIQVQSVKCSRGSIQVQSVTSAAMAAFKCAAMAVFRRSRRQLQVQ